MSATNSPFVTGAAGTRTPSECDDRVRRLTLRAAHAAAVVTIAAASAGCGARTAPSARADYGLQIPVAGAPSKLAHGGSIRLGALQTGRVVGAGGSLDVRFRPGGSVTGGGVGGSFLLTESPGGEASPFFAQEAGLTLLGTSAARDRHPSSGSLDLVSPHAGTSIGQPIGDAGFSLMLSLTVDYLVRLPTEHANVCLLGVQLGVGVFNPRVDSGDNVITRTFQK